VDAGDRFIEDHAALVRGVARKLKAQLELVAELEDLVAAGFAGLVEAKTRFDPSRGTQFSTFAYYRVRGAIIDHARHTSLLSRRAYEHARVLESADRVAEEVADTTATAPVPTDATRAVRALDEAVARLTTSFVLSCVGPSEEAPECPESMLLGRESGRRVRDAVDTLPERERTIVVRHYFEGRQFDEVAAELGVSKSWVSRIHARALELLRGALAD
jgi:RNA polymerase sigma factor for flagellar operon FliA